MFKVRIIQTKTIFILALSLFLMVFQARAAVTIDTRSAGGAADNLGLSSLTWSHTTGSGTSRALLVGISTATTTLPVSLPANRVTGVTYNGVALTRVGTIVSSNSLNASEIFVLTNPPIGTANITATFGTTLAAIPVAFVNQAVGSAVSFFGVSQTSPTGTFASATGNSDSPIVNVSNSVVGDFIFDTLAVSPTAVNVNPSVGSNQTVCADPNDETTCTRGRRFFNFAYDVGAASTEPGATPSVLMTWIMTNADSWALGGVAVKQSVTTASTVTVGGQILTAATGRGVPRTLVTITDAAGATRSTITNFFGYYRFSEINAGETYILRAASKRHSFNPQAISVNGDLTELNLIAQP